MTTQAAPVVQFLTGQKNQKYKGREKIYADGKQVGTSQLNVRVKSSDNSEDERSKEKRKHKVSKRERINRREVEKPSRVSETHIKKSSSSSTEISRKIQAAESAKRTSPSRTRVKHRDKSSSSGSDTGDETIERPSDHSPRYKVNKHKVKMKE